MTSSLPARAIDGVFPPDQSIRRGPQRQPRRLEPCHGRFLPPQRRFEDHFRNRRVRAGGWRRQLCRQQHDPDPDPTAASELFRGRTDLLEHIISCNHANGVTTSDRPAGHRRWTDDRDRPDGLQSGLLRSRSEGRDRPAHVPRRDQRAAVLGSRISDRSALQPQRELEPGFLVQEPDLARAVWLQCFHSRPGRAPDRHPVASARDLLLGHCLQRVRAGPDQRRSPLLRLTRTPARTAPNRSMAAWAGAVSSLWRSAASTRQPTV